MTPEKFVLGWVKCMCSSCFPDAVVKYADQSISWREAFILHDHSPLLWGVREGTEVKATEELDACWLALRPVLLHLFHTVLDYLPEEWCGPRVWALSSKSISDQDCSPQTGPRASLIRTVPQLRLIGSWL